jgi:general stress protein 26
MAIEIVKERLQDWFSFPGEKLFCQLTTTSNGRPHIRTMDLYDVTDSGALIFLTKTSSRKWKDLKKEAHAAVCLLNLESGQITVEGKAELQTTTNNLSFVTYYWENYLPKYWQDFYLSLTPENSALRENIPSSFGVIKIIPERWEILEINTEDFLKGSRKSFEFINNEWQMEELELE